ncbi:hypothetical protein [Corynebacterium renale]|uniref:hypothetical protein n=1 Tax=Corynebacterium renale TaxID=1724 RepID=UPI000DF9531C|nr:hypothetical protein [Corynebacterium renale]STD00965.1 putative cell surface glycoprotein [Corynebacterium renale]
MQAAFGRDIDEASVAEALGEQYQHLAGVVSQILTGEADPALLGPVQEEVSEDPDVAPEVFTAPTPEAEPATEPQPAAPQSGGSLADALRAQLNELDTSALAPVQVNPDDFLEVPTTSFAPYAFGTPVDKSSPYVQARRNVPETDTNDDSASRYSERGTVFLSWANYPAPEGSMVMYRVVASNAEMVDRSPENGEQLVVTVGRAYEDADLGMTAMRHYTVWAYAGSDLRSMLTSQPVFVGEAAVVFPPEVFEVREASGTIQGFWDPLEGHVGHKVYARPQPSTGTSAAPLDNPANEFTNAIGSRDFSYPVKEKGKTYEFQVFGQARFDGRIIRDNHGTPIRTARIEAEVEQVSLMNAATVGDNLDEISLVWMAPSTGRVVVYLSEQEPNPELSTEPIQLDYIDDDEALSEATKYDDDSPAGTKVARLVKWPNYHRVYITLVNVVGDTAWVSDSMVQTRIEDITEARLIERVDSQLITFDWPGGATLVQIEREGHPTHELLHSEYVRQGGVRLHLTPTGESNIRLVPSAMWKGQYTKALNPKTLSYRGVRKYSYTLQRVAEGTKLFIWSVGQDDRNPPTFVLRYHPDRFPLYPGDGEDVLVAQVTGGATVDMPQTFIVVDQLHEGNPGQLPEDTFWWVQTNPRGGYYRLFVHDSSAASDPSAPRRVVLETGDPRFIYQGRN